jgi:hypothetical protein
MPDLKISELPAATAPGDGDIAPLVQQGTTRRASFAQLREAVLAERGVHVRDFGALGNGSADDAPAIQAAVNALKAKGGGTVHLGPRNYRIASPILVDGVTIRFQGSGFTEAGGPGDGTWLSLDQTNFTPFRFTGAMARGSAVRDLAVRQFHGAAFNASWAPTDYPWVFRVEDCFGGVDFDNVMLAGVTRGIFARNSGRVDIRRLRGQVFRCAVEMDEIYDVPRMMNLHIWPFWSANDHVIRWQQANGDAFLFRRVDGVFIDQSFVLGYRSMFRFASSAAGVTWKFSIGQAYADFVKYGLWIEGDGTDGQIDSLTTQGEIFNGDGAPLPGAIGIHVAANACRVQIGNLRVDDAEDSPVRIEGHSNRLDVFASRFVNFNMRNNGAAAFHLANAASGAPNRVNLGSAPLLETPVPGPLVNAGTNGSVGASAPAGSAAKPGVAVGVPDTGVFRPFPGAVSLGAAGMEVLRGAPDAGADTWLGLKGMSGLVLAAAETPNVSGSIGIAAKGSGAILLGTGGGVQAEVGHVPAAVNALRLRGAATGNPAAVGSAAQGVDANIATVVGQPKGTGALLAQFPDGGAGGGAARGPHAVDLQTLRGAPWQVAAAAASTIAGGLSNALSGTASAIPGGQEARDHGQHGTFAYASGGFGGGPGTAQLTERVLRGETTGAGAIRLTTDGGAPSIVNTVGLPAQGSLAARLVVVARQAGGSAGSVGDTAMWSLDVLLSRGPGGMVCLCQGLVTRGGWTSSPTTGGSGAIIPSAATHAGAAAAAGAGADNWRIEVAADASHGGLSVTATGEANKTIRWVARVVAAEVAA